MTDPRLLLGLAEPEIPVRLGRLKLYGRITNYEHEDFAVIGITLYHYGPPLQALTFHRPFAWPEVYYTWESGRPLDWYQEVQ